MSTEKLTKEDILEHRRDLLRNPYLNILFYSNRVPGIFIQTECLMQVPELNQKHLEQMLKRFEKTFRD